MREAGELLRAMNEVLLFEQEMTDFQFYFVKCPPKRRRNAAERAYR
jgi:hypothetical protein